MKDQKPKTRRLAAEILGKMGNASATDALVQQVSDPDAGVRAAALTALGGLRAESAAESILAALEDREPEVRLQALAALAEQPPDWLAGLVAEHRARVRERR